MKTQGKPRMKKDYQQIVFLKCGEEVIVAKELSSKKIKLRTGPERTIFV